MITYNSRRAVDIVHFIVPGLAIVVLPYCLWYFEISVPNYPIAISEKPLVLTLTGCCAVLTGYNVSRYFFPQTRKNPLLEFVSFSTFTITLVFLLMLLSNILIIFSLGYIPIFGIIKNTISISEVNNTLHSIPTGIVAFSISMHIILYNILQINLCKNILNKKYNNKHLLILSAITILSSLVLCKRQLILIFIVTTLIISKNGLGNYTGIFQGLIHRRFQKYSFLTFSTFLFILISLIEMTGYYRNKNNNYSLNNFAIVNYPQMHIANLEYIFQYKYDVKFDIDSLDVFRNYIPYRFRRGGNIEIEKIEPTASLGFWGLLYSKGGFYLIVLFGLAVGLFNCVIQFYSWKNPVYILIQSLNCYTLLFMIAYNVYLEPTFLLYPLLIFTVINTLDQSIHNKWKLNQSY